MKRFLSKNLCFVLVLMLCISLMPVMNTSAAGFTARTTFSKEDCNLIYWTKGSYGTGNGFPRNWDLAGGNCTWYAFGRAWEILGTLPKLCTNNAGAWWEYNRTKNYYPYGSQPKRGAIAVWDKYDNNNGHVAVVEEIGSNYIITSESGWSFKDTNFKTRERSLNSSCLDQPGSRFLGYIYIIEDNAPPSIHNHNYKYVYYWKEHPHWNCYRCTICGDVKAGTGNDRVIIQGCAECAPPPAPTPPSAPSIRVSDTNFAVGKNVTVSWNAISKATSYNVTLEHSSNSSYSQKTSVTGTSASFNIDNAGSYSINVWAKNEAGSSGKSNTVRIQAHAPLAVTFKDHDGTILSKQTVNYEGSATAPDSPTREGYTFTGWSQGFAKVTSDLTVTAQYKINTYTVRFIDREGETIGNPQKVEYKKAATPPTPPTAPVGYVFSGWDTEEYKDVRRDLNVYAVYLWENNELPISFTTTPTVRRNEMGSGYTADLKLYNYPQITTDGKIVIVLKTANGKMVASKTEAISLSAGAKAERSVFVPYNGVASTAEVTVVAVIDNDKTGVPISKKAVINVDLSLEWSDWSTVKPEKTDGIKIEERTEYRYRTKSTKKTEAGATMEGWTLYNTTSYWDEWRAWGNVNPGSSSTRQSESRWIEPKYTTKYHYERFKLSNNGLYHFCIPTAKSAYGNNSIYSTGYQEIVRDTPFASYYKGPHTHVSWCDCLTRIPGMTLTQGRTTYSYNTYKDPWYNERTVSVQTEPGYTQWRYRDLHYVYHFYKWNKWSEWSATSISATTDREVQTRKTYRYKSQYTEDMEDQSGTVRKLSGQIANAADGKQVTLYVFKGSNTDPTESQLEYVGQSTLKNGGKYEFKYITKEEPTEKTGDFIIMIGVEGGGAPFYVDTIKAPRPKYEVIFMAEGKALSTQTITEGETAAVPEAPEKEGYTFVGWDSGTTNVHDNMTIHAVYVPKEYSVIFLDYKNETVEIKTFKHGDALACPEPVQKEGSKFIGWDKIIEGTKTVTENMVITASYQENEYQVTFYDSNGDVISRQTVQHGEAAEIPGDPVKEGFVFDKWSRQEALSAVSQDLALYPEFKYTQTAEIPSLNMYMNDAGDKNIITLSAIDNDAIIYYTTDGSEPYVVGSELGIEDSNGTVYEEALEIEPGTLLKAVSYVSGKNTSQVMHGYATVFSEEGTDTPDTPSGESGKVSITEFKPYGNKISATVYNGTEDPVSFKIQIAAYSTQNKLLSYENKDVIGLSSGQSSTLEVNAVPKAEKYQAFVWNSTNLLQPLTVKKILLP